MELDSPLSPAEIVRALATAPPPAGGAAQAPPEPGPFQGHIDQHGFTVVLARSRLSLQFAELAGKLVPGGRGTRVQVQARMSLHAKVVVALVFAATLALVLLLPKHTWKAALPLLLVVLVYPLDRLHAVARLRRCLRA